MSELDRKCIRSRRLDSLTALRGLAAVLVFGRHAAEAWGPAGNHLFVQSASAVSFFFMLSGFVLTWSSKGHDRPLGFYRRRLARIYPAYLVALIIGGAINHQLRSYRHLLLTALLVQSWVPDHRAFYALNGVSWSLSCEAFFYLLFPLVVPGFIRLTRSRRRLLLLLLVAIAIAIPGAVRSTTIDHGVGFWVIYVFPLSRLPEFLIGVLVAVEVRDGARSPIGVSVAVGLCALAYLIAGWLPVYLTWVAVTLLPYIVLITSAARADLDGSAGWLRKRPLIVLGQWSYAFYLLHQGVLALFRHAVPRPTITGATLLSGAALVAALISACGLFVWVERPLERRLRGDHALPVSEGGSGHPNS